MKQEMNDARIASLSAHTERTKAEAELEQLRLEIEQQTEAGLEQLAEIKAKLDQLLLAANNVKLDLEDAAAASEKYSLAREMLTEQNSRINGQRKFFASSIKGVWDKFVEEHSEQIAQAKLDLSAFAPPEQPIGTVGETEVLFYSSGRPTKTGMAKIKAKIAMNIDLIAKYFAEISWLNAEKKAVDRHPAGYFRNSAMRQVQNLIQKKSALEAKIMEKLMAE